MDLYEFQANSSKFQASQCYSETLSQKQTPHQTIPHEVPKYAGNACETLTDHLINNRLSSYSPMKHTQNMIHKIYRYIKKNITKTYLFLDSIL